MGASTLYTIITLASGQHRTSVNSRVQHTVKQMKAAACARPA